MSTATEIRAGRERRVLAHLASWVERAGRHEHCTTAAIGFATGLSTNQSYKLLKRLERAGEVSSTHMYIGTQPRRVECVWALSPATARGSER